MSADNYLYIDRRTNEVWGCIASEVMPVKGKKGLEKQKSYLIGKGKDLEEALKIACESEFETEYGIYFKLWAK